MATNAGQGISAIVAGDDERSTSAQRISVSNLQLPLPELRPFRLPPGAAPYESEDAISPPSLSPQTNFRSTGLRETDSPPVSLNSPVHYGNYPGFCTDRIVGIRLAQSIARLETLIPYWEAYGRHIRTVNYPDSEPDTETYIQTDTLVENRTDNQVDDRTDSRVENHVDNQIDGPTDNQTNIQLNIAFVIMEAPTQPQLLFVDGTFAELAQEVADTVQVGAEVRPLLDQHKNEEALQAIVKASHHLNTIPEHQFTGAYNLLVHLILQSQDPKKYLPTVCGNLLKPITSSPQHGFTLAANALSTVFNLIPKENPLRFHVYIQIIRFAHQHSQFDLLKRQLDNLEGWFETWDTSEEDQRRLHLEISETAADSGDNEEAYHYLLKALETFDREDQEEITSEEAQKLSLKAVRMAISTPTRFDFHSLRNLPSVQALSDSHPVYSQLLDIFAEQDLEDYNDFRDEHQGWIEKESLDHDELQRKMRILTFASLAASTTGREIAYDNIAKALQVPDKDVEMWAIDVVRTGLVEGRLSQQKKVFLVHRTHYRVFGEKQWRELATRVEQYKSVLGNILGVVRKAEADVQAQREREQQELERRLANAGISGGQGSGDRRRQPQRPRTDEDD